MNAQQKQIAQVVEGVFEDKITPSPAEKRKRVAVTAGKGLGIVASVALSAYLSMQQAISDRPTRQEVADQISAIESGSVKLSTESLSDRRKLEIQVTELKGEVRALSRTLAEGFADIKEELRYLRRRRNAR